MHKIHSNIWLASKLSAALVLLGVVGVGVAQAKPFKWTSASDIPTLDIHSQNDAVAHIPLHNQVIPWAMKKNIDVVHRPDNRLDWTLIKVN